MAPQHLKVESLLLSSSPPACATVDETVYPLILPSPKQCHPKKPHAICVGTSLLAPSPCCILPVTHTATNITPLLPCDEAEHTGSANLTWHHAIYTHTHTHTCAPSNTHHMWTRTCATQQGQDPCTGAHY